MSAEIFLKVVASFSMFRKQNHSENSPLWTAMCFCDNI